MGSPLYRISATQRLGLVEDTRPYLRGSIESEEEVDFVRRRELCAGRTLFPYQLMFLDRLICGSSNISFASGEGTASGASRYIGQDVDGLACELFSFGQVVRAHSSMEIPFNFPEAIRRRALFSSVSRKCRDGRCRRKGRGWTGCALRGKWDGRGRAGGRDHPPQRRYHPTTPARSNHHRRPYLASTQAVTSTVPRLASSATSMYVGRAQEIDVTAVVRDTVNNRVGIGVEGLTGIAENRLLAEYGVGRVVVTSMEGGTAP